MGNAGGKQNVMNRKKSRKIIELEISAFMSTGKEAKYAIKPPIM
jgi:hypothetical protein